MKTMVRPSFVLVLVSLLVGCPSPPFTPVSDVDTTDAMDSDTFIPLSLNRLIDSVGEIEGSERVSVFGTGFQEGAKIFFGENRATGLLVMSHDQINCNVPAGEAGLVSVRVENLNGDETTLEHAYLYRGKWELTGIEPAAMAGHQTTTVTLKGEGFTKETRILIGGRLLENTVLSDSETITGQVPARLEGRRGSVHVIASNGFEQRILIRAFLFEDELQVGWLSPTTGSHEGGAVVTLYGNGFSPESQVTIDGKVAETLIGGDGHSITIRTPPGSHGAADVRVENPFESQTLAAAFHYADPDQLPEGLSLENVWPAQGQATGGDQVALAVFGLAEAGGAQDFKVTFNGMPAEIVKFMAYQNLLVVKTPPGELGKANLSISIGGNESSRTDLFTFGSTLTLVQAVPAIGVPEGGESITLKGDGLSDDMVVFFGRQPAEIVAAHDDGSVTVTSPAASPGRVDIRIYTKGKRVILGQGFAYQSDKPTRILGFTTPEGAQAGGRLLQIFGEGLQHFDQVITLGTHVIEPLTIVDDATIAFRSPVDDVGSMNIIAGSAGALAMVYKVFDPTSKYGGTHGGTIAEALNVTVLEISSRDPITDAFVILWDDIGTPYQGVTDARGQITFSDPGFGPPQMVTASKDNHTTSSMVDFDARNVTLFLYSFEPAPPGPPGPPDPPQIVESRVSGTVGSIEKYIIVPPSDCDAVGANAPGTLCDPCETHEDCEGEGARCTNLGDQGMRCTTACETDDNCPGGFVCMGVGFGAIQCVPEPGKRTAICGLTRSSVFSYEAGPQGDEDAEPVEPETPLGFGVFVDEGGTFNIESRPGEYAVVCFGGYLQKGLDGNSFVAMQMGVRRHVFISPNEDLSLQDVKLDIPLSRDLTIRFDGALIDSGDAYMQQVDVFIDLGADGVFRMPNRGFAWDQKTFLLKNFPAKFEESLYDATYTILARAYPEKTSLGESNDASFVMLQELAAVNDDTAFEILDNGIKHFQTGMTMDIHGLHGAGTKRLWATSTDGVVLAYDGTWWGLQQTSSTETLRAVWARSESDIVAVGDNGTLLQSDGLIWTPIKAPQELNTANWTSVAAVGDDLWFAGDQGLWRYDGVEFHLLLGKEGERPQVIRGMWPQSAVSVWLVGEGGLIRHWTPEGFESFDRAGADLLAIHGFSADDIWVAGEQGRMLHYDGAFFFEYLPLTKSTLRAVHGAGPTDIWATGDNGTVLHWDGDRWDVPHTAQHVDLTGVRVTTEGKVVAVGRSVIIAGPFLDIAKPMNPNALGMYMGSPISWLVTDRKQSSVTVMGLTEVSGFPFWTLFVKGERRMVPLPDLATAWGLNPIWDGSGFLRLTRIYSPDMTIDRFDYTMLSQYQWQSWSVADFPVAW